ncbi:DUF6973 domain-containing protein [Xenorhabdus bovienii]|uniref:DUF6973 domain-containing protein n=2 Tax=Xenorhabdus bovienii TaxID=40576 RepID=UPI0023B23AC0|nr:hypothetical protein [Xenorhabdus bovienii]MDE9467051.1 hypothetical protein [Xenorhabdus bovienii]
MANYYKSHNNQQKLAVIAYHNATLRALIRHFRGDPYYFIFICIYVDFKIIASVPFNYPFHQGFFILKINNLIEEICMSHSLIAYYENGIPYTADGQRVLKVIPAAVSGRAVLDRIKSDFMPSTPEMMGGIGYGGFVKPHYTLTGGAMYAPGGGISARDMAKMWEANGKEGICAICSRKGCPFIEKEIKKALGYMDQYSNNPNGENIALARSSPVFTKPLLNIKNMFNSTAPVVMSHLSALEDKRFYSTTDNLKGLFADRCLLDTNIGSFKSLSANAQMTLQIFAYGNECRESKYNNFYHHMGSVNGSGIHSQFGHRDYELAIRELHNNMAPTLKNVFVLDELTKEFGNKVSSYVKEVGQLARDFLAGSIGEGNSKDIVENQYNYWFFPGKGDKSTMVRDVQHALFGLGNMKAALQIGSITPGSTNISTNAQRFATQGNREAYPDVVLKSHSSNEGDQVGAMRHPLWQAAITAKFGEDVASRVADAHERYRTLDLNIRQFSTRSDADQTVDMLNNREGREIGKRNPDVTMKVQANAVLNHFHKEGFYVIKENASGFAVDKQRITDEQFHYMKGQYDRGDDHGFSPEQIAAGKKNEPFTKYYP